MIKAFQQHHESKIFDVEHTKYLELHGNYHVQLWWSSCLEGIEIKTKTIKGETTSIYLKINEKVFAQLVSFNICQNGTGMKVAPIFLK